MQELTAEQKYRIECEVRIANESKVSNMNKGLKPYGNKPRFDFAEVAGKVERANTYALQVEAMLSVLKGAEVNNRDMKFALEKVWKQLFPNEKYNLSAQAEKPRYLMSLEDIKEYMLSFDESDVTAGMLELCFELLYSVKVNEEVKLGAKLNRELIPEHLRNKYNKLAKEDLTLADKEYYFEIQQGDTMVEVPSDSSEVVEFLGGINNGIHIHDMKYRNRKQRS